jgi:hypothetical protein
MKSFMKSIDIKFRYWGDMVTASVYQEENNHGVVYPIKLNDNYFLTLHYTEKNEWVVLREKNKTTLKIDKELLSRILKPLEQELKYAA